MVQQITISRCAGRGERPYLQFTFGVPLRTHPGIVFKLTANPTDTRSQEPLRESKQPKSLQTASFKLVKSLMCISAISVEYSISLPFLPSALH
jgi:hypothetical protein